MDLRQNRARRKTLGARIKSTVRITVVKLKWAIFASVLILILYVDNKTFATNIL